MKRGIFYLVAVMTLACAASVQAAIVIKPSGDVSFAQVIYQGRADFINPANGFNMQLGDTFAVALAIGLAPGTLDVSYSPSDLNTPPNPWGSGIRWTEEFFNSSTVAWQHLDLTLGATGTFFSDPLFSPALVDLTYTPLLTLTKNPLLGTVTVSPDGKTEHIQFSNPILPGQSFVLHAPIQGLAGQSSFTLTETPTAIPEPVSIAIWSTLGGLGVGAAALRRRRAARKTAWSAENRAAILRVIETGRHNGQDQVS